MAPVAARVRPVPCPHPVRALKRWPWPLNPILTAVCPSFRCRGVTQAPNWALTLSDAFGALAGPLAYATAVAPGAAGALPALSPVSWLHLSALAGVVLCAASAFV